MTVNFAAASRALTAAPRVRRWGDHHLRPMSASSGRRDEGVRAKAGGPARRTVRCAAINTISASVPAMAKVARPPTEALSAPPAGAIDQAAEERAEQHRGGQIGDQDRGRAPGVAER